MQLIVHSTPRSLWVSVCDYITFLRAVLLDNPHSCFHIRFSSNCFACSLQPKCPWRSLTSPFSKVFSSFTSGFLRASFKITVWHLSFALSAVCSLNETNSSTWAVSCPPPGFRTILRAFLWESYSFLLRHEHRPKAEGMGHWVTAWVTLKFTFLGKGVIQYDHLELLKSKCFLYSNQASKVDSNTCPDFVYIYHLCFRSNLASYQ